MVWCTRRRWPGRTAPVTKSARMPERQVDVEDPAPRQVGHAQPADQRPDDRGHGEHGPEEPHVAAAVARRDDVADDGLRADHQPATAQSLHGAEGDELRHGVAEARQRRTDDEDHDRGLEEDLPPVLVAELAPQRRRHRRRQQVGGDHPGEVRPPVQVADDGRQRGRDDGLVERRQQHPQQERAEDQPEPATGDLARPRGVLRRHSHPPHRRLPRSVQSRNVLLEMQPWAGRRLPPPDRSRRDTTVVRTRLRARRPRATVPAAPADHRRRTTNQIEEGLHSCELASPSCSGSSTPSCWPAWGASPTRRW